MQHQKTLTVLLLLAAGLFGFLIWPYLTALILAVIAAVLAAPLHNRIKKMLGGRNSVSAFLSTALVIIVIGLPLFLFIGLALKEAVDVVLLAKNFLEQGQHVSGNDLRELQQRLSARIGPSLSLAELQTFAANAARHIGSKLLQGAGSFAAGIANAAVGLILFVITLFFLLRDGKNLIKYVRQSPLIDDAVVDGLTARFRAVIDAIVLGNLTIAALQGLVVGVAFIVFGIKNALLAGLATALFALIPAVGPLIIILPAGIYLYLTAGIPHAIAFIAITWILTAIIDNFLKPILLERRLRVHPLLIFLSLFGGISVFGFLGILYGPLIAAVFLTLLDMRTRQSSLPRVKK